MPSALANASLLPIISTANLALLFLGVGRFSSSSVFMYSVFCILLSVFCILYSEGVTNALLQPSSPPSDSAGSASVTLWRSR